MTTRHYLSVAETAAREAGRILRDKLGRITVRHKKNAFDLVTEADEAAQEAIERILCGEFPEHGFLGEEGGVRSARPTRDGEFCWVVDPVDGTTNYVHGVPLFCTSIALLCGEVPVCAVVYNPVMEEFYTARQGHGAFLNGRRIRTSSCETLGEALVAITFPTITTPEEPDFQTFLKSVPVFQAIRRTGSAALNLAYVAAGRFDASWSFKCHPWDAAAGILLVREAGGVTTRPDGMPLRLLDDPTPFCATANAKLHAELAKIFIE